MNHPPEWPPFYWKALAFLGGLFLMLNHFHDQGIRFSGSEALFRFLAIWVSPFLLFTAGVLALIHARRAPSGAGFSVPRLVISSLIWSVVALVPLVLLESALFPVGHGVPQGAFIALRHLPFVGVFLAGLWSVGKIYRSSWHKLRSILSPAPAGFLVGSALVYVCVFLQRVSHL